VIISFGWTTPALIAGQKTVTRRELNDAYQRIKDARAVSA
jgi:hypothetical protein